MDRRSGSKRKEARTATGSSSCSDRITALPLELRAQIASLLSFDEAVKLTVLSRAWRHIHLHTAVVEINLVEFLSFWDIYSDEAQSVRAILDEYSILGVRVALGRRALEPSSSKVDTLRIVSDIDDPRMRRHAARIIALADARVIRFLSPVVDADARNDAWSLDLPPAARELEVVTFRRLALAIAGPGAAALLKLCLEDVVLGEWPHLPSLVYLDLNNVTVEAPFAPGAWCPLLEELNLVGCGIEQARVDIRLPRLMFLDMDTVDVAPRAAAPEAPPYGVITIDAPELIEFEMCCGSGATTDYKSFTLRAPRLRVLRWRNQYSERMVIDVGRPGSVSFGGITLTSNYPRGMMDCMEQMMRMLQGLLPNIPPENLDDVAKPYLTLEDLFDSDDDDDDDDEPKREKEKQLTCNLKGLISSHGI